MSLTEDLTHPFSRLLDLVLPVECRHCKGRLKPGGSPFFCSGCWASLPRIGRNVCFSCGLPFASPAATFRTPRHRCGDCRKKPPLFDRARAAGRYEGVLAEAIHLFKFQGKTFLKRPFGKLATTLLSRFPPLDCVIPVPLHPERLREREFNQALLICDELVLPGGGRVIPDGLHRKRQTRPQIGLKALERRKNVRGAFVLKRPEAVRRKKVLLVDDVFTTGATAQECARVLKRGGAREVHVLTLARAAGPAGSA
ncbi:MAG TPA: ComF family protein [Nitrospiria bacterium]|nr:ComF family protein [Nitrospiria bacterium]